MSFDIPSIVSKQTLIESYGYRSRVSGTSSKWVLEVLRFPYKTQIKNKTVMSLTLVNDHSSNKGILTYFSKKHTEIYSIRSNKDV